MARSKRRDRNNMGPQNTTPRLEIIYCILYSSSTQHRRATGHPPLVSAAREIEDYLSYYQYLAIK